MFGDNSYFQFLDSATDPGHQSYNYGARHSPSNHPRYEQNNLQVNFDLVSIKASQNQMDVILAKNFVKRPYPVDFGFVNPFCPICGKFVSVKQNALTLCSERLNKNFLAHEECLQKQQSNGMFNGMFEQHEEAKITPMVTKKLHEKKSIALGRQQYYLELKITHSLSDYQYLKQPCKLNGTSKNIIKWQIHQDEQTDPYIPTVVCFPFSDFALIVSLTCMATGEKTTFKMYINLGRLKYNELKNVTAETDQLKVQLKIFYQKQEKQDLIESMNFKYRYDLGLPVPIVEIVSVEANLPEDDQFEDDETDEFIENSAIMDAGRVLNEETNHNTSVSTIELMNNSQNMLHESYYQNVVNYDYDNLSRNSRNSGHNEYSKGGVHHYDHQHMQNSNGDGNNNYNPMSPLQRNNTQPYHNPINGFNAYHPGPHQQQTPSTRNQSGFLSTDNLSDRSYNNNKHKNEYKDRMAMTNSSSHPNNSSGVTNKFDLEHILMTENLSTYVRNNTQSRQFQNFLNEANTHQVDVIIETLYTDLPQLIKHEYANYMVQKLFGVCNYIQRLKIMQRLQQDIANIVRNKQGTHTIQALVKFFTNKEEYKLMCDSIDEKFVELSCHPNSTHFVQKIIDLFPIEDTIRFFHYAEKNFLTLGLDKNGMCVIKHMMRLIAEVELREEKMGKLNEKYAQGKCFEEVKEETEGDNNPKGNKSETSDQSVKRSKVMDLTSEVKKKFINEVTFSIDKIIQDAYGNYIIQFCYQLFGEDKSMGITEMIIQRFQQFSLQKYSSSVVFKCVACYWTKNSTFARLKQALTADAIIELFRSKDGNKILIEIMERHEGTPVRDKIYNQLVMGEPTKFNHDRWGVVLGIRSGTVGTEFTSFSDALKKGSPSKNGGGKDKRGRNHYY